MYYYINYDMIKKENFNNFEKDSCDLDIDKIRINRRNESYEKLINKLINEKSILFNKDQIKIMKNKNQYYSDDYGNIKNISEEIYSHCKNDFDSNLNNNSKVTQKKYPNTEYDYIKNMLGNNISNASSYKDNKIKVLENENYLKNYYRDVFGNKIKSNLTDYYANYFVTIDNKYGEESKEAIKVDIEPGNSSFVIPNQYYNNKHMTNAYNIDWSRIINPITYY